MSASGMRFPTRAPWLRPGEAPVAGRFARQRRPRRRRGGDLERQAPGARAALSGTGKWRRARVAARLVHHFVLPGIFDSARKMLLSARLCRTSRKVIERFRVRVGRRKPAGRLAARRFSAPARRARVEAGEVAYEIERRARSRGRPALRLKVRGTLTLRCQRCLEAMAFEVQSDETLVLAGTRRDPRRAGRRARARPGGRGQGDAGARADRGRADPRAAVRAAARRL